jgi:hypothetical protein
LIGALSRQLDNPSQLGLLIGDEDEPVLLIRVEMNPQWTEDAALMQLWNCPRRLGNGPFALVEFNDPVEIGQSQINVIFAEVLKANRTQLTVD